MRYEVALAVIAVTAISSCVIGFRMRREIKKTLGRKATDTDLTSIATWMEVRQEEDEGPLNPK
jgi:carbamate kinase